MKFNQLLFGTVGFVFLFGSAGYFYGHQVRTDQVSSFETAHVMQADVFDFKNVDLLTIRDAVKMAEVILFKESKYDVRFVMSENEVRRINENIAVIEINTKHLNANVEFLQNFKNSIELDFGKLEADPVSLFFLQSDEDSVKKIEPKKPKAVCPPKKPGKLDHLKRFKKSASWI